VKRVLSRLGICLALIVAFAVWSGNALAAGDVVISQVYGGGGNAGAALKNDFIELYNPSSTSVSLTGWSVQYAASAGTTWQKTTISGTLAPGAYYLVQEQAGAGGTTALPTPNATGTINMSATAGKVALVGNATTLAGSCPAGLVDLVGFGTANCFEGAGAAPSPPNNTTAVLRQGSGSVDTGNNAADFAVGTANPRSGGVGDAAPSVASTIPANGASDIDPATNLAVTFSEPVSVDTAWFTIQCSVTGDHTATVSGGPVTFTLDPTTSFAFGELCTTTISATTVHDQDALDPPDTMVASFVWTITTSTPPVTIPEIQGAGQVSPLADHPVSGVRGIVTAVKSTGSARGFFMQDAAGDGDPSTSDGIYVFTGSTTPSVAPGDSVKVSGTVKEFVAASAPDDLPTTEIVSPTTVKLAEGNALPAPVNIGQGGLTPPTSRVTDGIAFDEALEGMLVQFNDLQTVSRVDSFGEVWAVPDNGVGAGVLTPRGGLILQKDDANPEKFRFDDDLLGSTTPAASVGATSPGVHIGVMDYAFDNYAVHFLSAPVWQASPIQKEVTQIVAGPDHLTVATFNMENLAPDNPQSKFDGLANVFVNNLRAPDIVALEEVQDSSGATDNGVVDSTTTLDLLNAAIQRAGGPRYAFAWVNPVNDEDGGQPGGNIRVVFAYRTDVPGLSLAPGTPGGSLESNAVLGTGAETTLKYNPGRVDPTNSAWNSSRKPLAGQFLFNGHSVFVIANHFVSKLGDDPMWGTNQPPVNESEAQRHEQAHEVAGFTSSILAANPSANVFVLGDLNDFQFSDTVSILEAAGLHPLIDDLPVSERYSYVFDGNSQAIDHTLVAGGLLSRPHEYDPVHVNAEFAVQVSDHDPQVTGVTFAPPSVSAGGPYTVGEGASVPLAASGLDAGGGSLTYRWNLDGDTSFETAGATPTFSAASIDGPATRTVSVQVTAPDGATAVASTTVTIGNVAPTAIFTAPAGALAPNGFALSLAQASDPSAADTAAGFTYAFDCGAGYGPWSTSQTTTCDTTDVGPLAVRGAVRDKDGGVSEYTATVAVTVTVDSLCATVTAWAKNAGEANSLCVKLQHGQIEAFGHEVDAQTEKAFTSEQAALLKRLAARL
jgi:predicted extracellular nuclease